MNNKELDSYLKFIFDYVQKYVVLSKDFESIEKKNGIISAESKSKESKSKKTSVVKAIKVLEDFIPSNSDVDNQQELLISDMIDSIENSIKSDKKTADYFVQSIGKQNINKKKNSLEYLQSKLDIINDFVLHDDTSFKQISVVCKENAEQECSLENCPRVREEDEDWDEIKDRCKHKKEKSVNRELHLTSQTYCKLNHAHKILSEIPKDKQNFLSINIYPSITPKITNNPFKVCSIENCICSSIKYMNEKTCSIETDFDKKLYKELTTSEDSKKRCGYMKIYESQEDKKIKLSNRLESIIIDDLELLESKLNRLDNIVKELKKK
ncbi:MAG: hypothetical protein IKN42_01670 [Elusimicrobia bacterium]|nr:hypothetical protein [Elusimicrobiota bacterium]